MPRGFSAFVAEYQIVFTAAAVVAITFQYHGGFVKLLEDVLQDLSICVENFLLHLR